jgi:hypothetical protein
VLEVMLDGQGNVLLGGEVARILDCFPR